jgi:hypothetical protein
MSNPPFPPSTRLALLTDTLASYRIGYGRAILDPGLVVIVAEDYLDEAEDEDGGTHPLVREIAANEREGREREKVVVATCRVS